MSNTFRRPTFAEINLTNLAFNLKSVKKFIGEDLLYMAVVKADAYGHGALECAAALEKAGADWFGVAIPEEGIELRKAGIRKRILCLGGFWRGQEKDLLNFSLTPVVYDIEFARLFNEAAEKRGVVAAVHIKIDTGMGRVGVPFDEVEQFAAEMSKLKNLQVEGMMTHFAAAENLSQTGFTDKQIKDFENAVAVFEGLGMRPSIKDLANSPGAIAHPGSRGNMVRLGGIIYGLGEDVLPQEIELPELKPVMSIYSEVGYIKRVPKGRTLGYGRTFETKRDSVIATLPIGYQDGYMRSFSNRADVIVNGARVKVVGRISMDWTIIDITDVDNVAVGERVTLIGSDGEERISAADLAVLADTISYEVTCGINRRVTRVYIDD